MRKRIQAADMTDCLTSAQRSVLEYIQSLAEGVGEVSDCHITINFHPDRKTPSGVDLLHAIALDGALKSQFETGLSNGSLSAFKGGARYLWESQAFNQLYDQSPPVERPKYGSLNYNESNSGASPRFGSSFFRLKPHVTSRTTFCYPESFFGPKAFAVGNRVENLIRLAESDDQDHLDHYIEAHVHGAIGLEPDVEALVLDPSYKSTNIEQLAHNLPVSIEWHKGFELSLSLLEQHPEYRGEKIVQVARQIAKNRLITPLIIGDAVCSGLYDDQDLKKVWHYLARFGDRNRPGHTESH